MNVAFNDNYDPGLVCKDISPDERMLADTLDGYLSVGRSTIDILRIIRMLERKNKFPDRILDFGSGHGRVARHFRAWSPNSKVYAADIRTDAIEYCARTLGCFPVQLTPKFGEAELPDDIDLVWVGSVFTHIDYKRMLILFDWLWKSVSRGGYLIITTHGDHAKRLVDTGAIRFISQEKWEKIINEYEETGCGYQSYGLQDLGDWGVSLVSMVDSVELSSNWSDAKLTIFLSGGWANLQDVVVWQKM